MFETLVFSETPIFVKKKSAWMPLKRGHVFAMQSTRNNNFRGLPKKKVRAIMRGEPRRQRNGFDFHKFGSFGS